MLQARPGCRERRARCASALRDGRGHRAARSAPVRRGAGALSRKPGGGAARGGAPQHRRRAHRRRPHRRRGGLVRRRGATVTSAAAEKIYRARDGATEIRVRLELGRRRAARLAAAADHRLRPGKARPPHRGGPGNRASFLAVEMLIFGRAAMGEDVHRGAWRDAWRVRRDGRLVFADAFRAEGRSRASWIAAPPSTAPAPWACCSTWRPTRRRVSRRRAPCCAACKSRRAPAPGTGCSRCAPWPATAARCKMPWSR